MTETRRALVVVDVQSEYFEGPMEIQYPPREDSLNRILEAMDAAEQADIPVVVVQHKLPEDAPIFAEGSAGFALHPQIEERLRPDTKRITKQFASVYDDTDFAEWCQQHDINTVTITGYMTNNCVLGTAEGAEPHGMSAEVLSDATGAIHISNEIGDVPAQRVHETIMTILHSNFAAVTTTEAWKQAITEGSATPMSNLVESALQGKASQS